MIRALAPLLAVVLATSASWAGDARVELGVQADANYDDNVFADAEDEQDDYFLRGGPMFRAYDQRGDFQWNAQYVPTYLKYRDFGELDGWEQVANGTISWVPSTRTRVFGSVNYADVSTFLRLAEVDPILGDTGTELTRQGVERLVAEVGAEHNVARRHALSLSLQRYQNDYELESRSDVTNTEASAGYLYDLSQRTRVGFELRYTRQEFEQRNVEQSATNYYNLNLQVLHSFSPTFFLSASVGPAYVDPEAIDRQFSVPNFERFPRLVGAEGFFGPVDIATCPTLDDGTPVLSNECSTLSDLSIFIPQLLERVTLSTLDNDLGGDASDVTYFASISLQKYWRHVNGVLQYVRDTSTSGDFGGSSVRDLVYGKLSWRATRRFTADLELSYQRFEAATDGVSYAVALRPFPVPVVGVIGEAYGLAPFLVSNQREDVVYRAIMRLRYELTPRTFLQMTVVWQRQSIETPPLVKSEFDRMLISFGVTYRFRSFPLGI
jgi:hypothetical protein